MYLNQLDEKTKGLFLNLAIYVAESNGVVDNAERLLINQYCLEMGITYSDKKEKNIDSILDDLKGCSKEIKNIIVVELMGLIISDGNTDITEKVLINEICDKLGVSSEKRIVLDDDIKDYYEVAERITKHIYE